MRIQSVNLASCYPKATNRMNYNFAKRFNEEPKEDTFESSGQNNVNFGSSIKWGGAIGTVLGTAAGVGITIMTGGAALPLVPVMAGAGGIGGDIVHAKIDEDYPKDYDSSLSDYDSYYY